MNIPTRADTSPLAVKHLRLLTFFAILSGIIYDSWPLGYVLNRSVADSLASNLEGLHQPYNWVFITGDIVSSVILLAIVGYLALRLPLERWLRAMYGSLALFAVGTIIDAALPLKCVTSMPSCPTYLHDPLLLAHGVCSILASVFLFIAILILWRRLRHNLGLHLLIIGYTLFGVVSLIDILVNSSSSLSQHYYITLCGVCIAIVPWAVQQGVTKQTLKKPGQAHSRAV
jgi:hypothetical protein